MIEFDWLIDITMKWFDPLNKHLLMFFGGQYVMSLTRGQNSLFALQYVKLLKACTFLGWLLCIGRICDSFYFSKGHSVVWLKTACTQLLMSVHTLLKCTLFVNRCWCSYTHVRRQARQPELLGTCVWKKTVLDSSWRKGRHPLRCCVQRQIRSRSVWGQR